MRALLDELYFLRLYFPSGKWVLLLASLLPVTHGRNNHVTARFHRVSRQALPDQQKQHPTKACQSRPTSEESVPSSFLYPGHLCPPSWHFDTWLWQMKETLHLAFRGLGGLMGVMLPPTSRPQERSKQSGACGGRTRQSAHGHSLSHPSTFKL